MNRDAAFQPEPELLTLRSAARRLGVGESQLRRALRDGELPSYTIGGWPRLKWREVIAWVDAQRVRPRNAEHARSVVEARLAHERARSVSA